MTIYDLSVTTASSPAPGAALLAIRATTRTVKVMEIRIVSESAPQTKVGLAVPTAAGITPTTFAPRPRDPRDAAPTSAIDTAWVTSPTAPTPLTYNRSETIAGVVGNGVAWPAWNAPYVVPIGTSLVLFNAGATAGGTMDVTVVLDE